MGGEIVRGRGMASGVTEMYTRGSDNRHTLKLCRFQSCIHQAGVGQRADMKYVCVDAAQSVIQSWYAECGGPILRFQPPIGKQAGKPGGATPPTLVADRKASDGHAVNDE